MKISSITGMRFRASLPGLRKAFFRSESAHRIVVFIAFLFLAFCFWLMKVFQDDFTWKYDLPLVFVGLPPNVVITNDLPESLHVTVSAKGGDIFRYNCGKGFDTVAIDLSQIDKSPSPCMITTEQLLGEISTRFYDNTVIVHPYPEGIRILYSRKESKQIPVIMNGIVQPSSQCMLNGQVEIIPKVVTAYSTAAVLDTLHAVSTVYFEEKDLQDTLRKFVLLEKTESAKFVPDKITLVVPVEEFTEKTIEVPVSAINLPANLLLRTFPTKINVTFFVVLSKFNSVMAADFELTVDYNDFSRNNASRNFPIYLSKFPDFVQNIRLTPSDVDLLLEEKSNQGK